MKLKDLNTIWHVGSNYAILSLPVVCYSVQPHWRNGLELDTTRHRFQVSFNTSVVFNESIEEEFFTIEDGQKACEKHLNKLLEHILSRLEKVVDFNSYGNLPLNNNFLGMG
ncbi:hypothetical protein EGI22_02815 [Lacihabitans sp. LS3-19]|uniref:hypothetical protein n=1 Tax=Lacihabitans sp. LS3-19 TaxID=2487335 RepID=UPI0020CFE280|nr:hypothetical protein [Lacihabitans sp. LS3-19]MCP9766824.1 hypothetical protein [Lacihabitans sp. LS3-19]